MFTNLAISFTAQKNYEHGHWDDVSRFNQGDTCQYPLLQGDASWLTWFKQLGK